MRAATLTLDDINIEAGWIRVIGKGDKQDIVPIGATVCRDLYTYINVHRRSGHRRRDDGLPERPRSHRGYALGYEGLALMIRRELKRIRTQAGSAAPM